MNLRQKFFYRVGIQGAIKSMLNRNIPVVGEGGENVPRTGGALVVANHRCWLDPLFVAAAIRRPIAWGGADFHFNMPMVRWFANEAGIIPIAVQGGKKSKASLKMAVDILNNYPNQLVGLFPEGVANFVNPSFDEKIIRFHTGFARIALEARAPVIPVAVVGHNERLLAEVPGEVMKLFTPVERMQHGAKMIIYESVSVNVGEPISLEQYHGREIDAHLLHEICRTVRRRVITLYDEKALEPASTRGA